MASATQRATSAGRSTPQRVSAAMRSRSRNANWMHGWCSAEACASRPARDAWKRAEGRRMTRGTAERGAGGRCRSLGLDPRLRWLLRPSRACLYSWSRCVAHGASGHPRPCAGMGWRVETQSLPRSMHSKLITNSYDRIRDVDLHYRTRHSYNEGLEPRIRLRKQFAKSALRCDAPSSSLLARMIRQCSEIVYVL